MSRLALIALTLAIVVGSPTAIAADHLAPRDGLYKGKTAQGAHISFQVEDARVSRPSYLVSHRGCGVSITFTAARRVTRRGRFFFGSRASDFFTGKFVTGRRVRGKAGIDFSGSSCPGSGVHEVRFRARLAD